MLEETEGAIKNGQSRDTRHRSKTETNNTDPIKKKKKQAATKTKQRR